MFLVIKPKRIDTRYNVIDIENTINNVVKILLSKTI